MSIVLIYSRPSDVTRYRVLADHRARKRLPKLCWTGDCHHLMTVQLV